MSDTSHLETLILALRDEIQELRIQVETLDLRLDRRPPGCQCHLPDPLSERELEVLALMAAGLSNGEIAARLVIATPTVKSHVSNIYGKLGVQTRTQALAYALVTGLCTLDGYQKIAFQEISEERWKPKARTTHPASWSMPWTG